MSQPTSTDVNPTTAKSVQTVVTSQETTTNGK